MTYPKVGSLLFIKENNKKRPYVCIKVYTNSAGVPYNWLVLPVTSTISVGMNNLFEIKHPKLSKKSYVKLNNIRTIQWSNSSYEVAEERIDINTIKILIDKLCNTIILYDFN